MKCCIVKDLLPNYIDGLTTEETNEEIRKHLETCEDCRRTCEQMSSEIPEKLAGADRKIDFLKKMRGQMRKRYAATIFLTCAVLAVLSFFAKNYDIPIPYDQDNMFVEIYQAVPIKSKFGITQWEDHDTLDFETSKAVSKERRKTIDLVRLTVTEPALWDSIQSEGRTIKRDGEEVRVVYYCYTRTLWNRLFPGADKPNRMVSTGDIYGRRLYRVDYEPMMTEIYYLPLNYRWMGRLSDEDFYAQKEHAVLVWSGMN